MHPNEIKITPDNITTLLKEATELSDAHVKALDEQVTRQNTTESTIK